MKDMIKGGKSDKLSMEDIARKHSVFVGTIQKQIEMGMKVEMEHTNNKKKAREIAMDHLSEFPDYYTRLDSMEKKAKKSKEPKEQTMAGSSGSYEAGLSMPVMKRDINNFKLKSKQKEFDESTTASVSAGAMYDAPIGHKQKDPLALDNVSANESASITAASTKDMIATKKGFPRFGGPDAKFVEIKDKCKTYPYCNQMSGYDNLVLKEINGMDKAIQQAAKKYGLTVKQVENILINESKKITEGVEDIFTDSGNVKALSSWTKKGRDTIYHIKTKEPVDLKTDDEIELAKLKMIFYKHHIDFDIEEFKK